MRVDSCYIWSDINLSPIEFHIRKDFLKVDI